MRKSIVVLAALAAGTLAAAPLGAQEIEHKANTRGLFFNGHFNGTSAKYSDPDATENGGGAGFQVGYGVTRSFTVFFGTDASRLSFGTKSVEDPGNFRIDFEDKYWLKQLEIGGRYNFVSPTRTWVPFVSAAYLMPFGGSDFTLYDMSSGSPENPQDGEFNLKKGSGATLGVGLDYFFSEKLALNVAASYSPVKFKEIEIKSQGDSFTDTIETKFNLTRVNFGFSWFPQLGR